ncbi:MAG: helix-turn-helix domain-containing protein [Prevotella sp.]|nr:helix-turn-helix domain-containing protein [Prevotella sp.]
MRNPISNEQGKEAVRLRKDGMTIKAIARKLHICDKRVSDYLKRSKSESEASGCGKSSKCKKNAKDFFLMAVKEVADNYEKACCQFVDTIHKTAIEDFIDILTDKKNDTKKSREKRVKARLDKIFDALQEVTYSAGCAAIFTMPPDFKKLWMDSIARDPMEAICQKESNKKTKK